jgi:hypothetical protein
MDAEPGSRHGRDLVGTAVSRLIAPRSNRWELSASPRGQNLPAIRAGVVLQRPDESTRSNSPRFGCQASRYRAATGYQRRPASRPPRDRTARPSHSPPPPASPSPRGASRTPPGHPGRSTIRGTAGSASDPPDRLSLLLSAYARQSSPDRATVDPASGGSAELCIRTGPPPPRWPPSDRRAEQRRSAHRRTRCREPRNPDGRSG